MIQPSGVTAPWDCTVIQNPNEEVQPVVIEESWDFAVIASKSAVIEMYWDYAVILKERTVASAR